MSNAELHRRAMQRLRSRDSQDLQWSALDKWRFYVIGTTFYSGLNVLLHPISVFKVRQQVLSNGARSLTFSQVWQSALQLHPTATTTTRLDHVRPFFRGLGVTLSLSLPARCVYITVLEGSKEHFGGVFSKYARRNDVYSPMIAGLSSGLAGGLAAVASQGLVVPMDVISQRQMVSLQPLSAREVFDDLLRQEGLCGLFRGFWLSIFSSLPTGSLWWATYGGCQHALQPISAKRAGDWSDPLRQAAVQVTCGMTAAAVAATCTQPLDVVRSRLQVGAGLLHHNVHLLATTASSSHGINATLDMASIASPRHVALQLYREQGILAFWRGLGPRTAHIGIWGTILSSAYECLRLMSRKH